MVKNPPVSAAKRRRFDPWVRKIPWSRAWQPTPVFLPLRVPWTEEPGGLELDTYTLFIGFSIMVYHGVLVIVPSSLL